MSFKEKLAFQMPLYVTRKDANGITGSYYINFWVTFLAMMLVYANVIGWSIFGIVTLVNKL